MLSDGWVKSGVCLALFLIADKSSSADLSRFLANLLLPSETEALSILDEWDFLPRF